MFHRLIRLGAALLLLAFLPFAARADQADIDAASRGVVRIVIIEDDGTQLYPISHGTGFAVTPEMIVTNAHVVAEAQGDRNLSIGIVPSDGGAAIYGKLVAYSPRNDLALVATTAPMHLPPLTIASNPDDSSGAVTAVGYPVNVDRAQGLNMQDLFNATPPVQSHGFLSGHRPSREFDTLLHTAPIGRGNSGGPLLDNCGRVIGVNSFGAESEGTDSEFYFAVSTRELLPFLRAHDVSAQLNGLPCKSLAELDEAERVRAEREQLAAMRQSQLVEARQAEREGKLRRQAEFAIMSERDDLMMLSMLLILGACAGGVATWRARENEDRRAVKIAGAVTAVALVGALAAWFLRPGFDQVDGRVADQMAGGTQPADGPTGVITPTGIAQAGAMTCVIAVDRSRVTTSKTDDVPLTWTDDGCVNGRTQYGLSGNTWSRVLVPETEAAVSVNSYDPATHEYKVERYLLDHDAMELARKARASFQAPECGKGVDAARELGAHQAEIMSLLPAQPNERLVYSCGPSG